jgi:hypothetical protein
MNTSRRSPDFKIRGNLELSITESQLLLDLVTNTCQLADIVCQYRPDQLTAIHHKLELLYNQLLRDEIHRQELLGE